MTIKDAPLADLLSLYRNGFTANALAPLGESALQMMRALNAEIINRAENHKQEDTK